MGVSIFLVIFMLIFFIFFVFSIYIFVQGVKASYLYLKLSLTGIKTEAVVVSIDKDMIRESVDEDGFTTQTYRNNYFEVVSYNIEEKEYENRLYIKGGSEKLYSIGDKVEIYYNKNNPNEIIDANSKSQFFKGIKSALFAFIFSQISFFILKNTVLNFIRK